MSTQSVAEEATAKNLPRSWRLPRMQEAGLILVILILGLIFTGIGRVHGAPGQTNPFLNLDNLVNFIATPMSIYAIMAVGQTLVIITGGIDISVGSIFALSGLGVAAVLQYMDQDASPWKVLPLAFAIAAGIGLACGLVNGILTTGLRIHPFIVTLGTLSIFRGLANVLNPTNKTLPAGDNVLPDCLSTDLFQRYFFKHMVGGLGVQILPMIVMLVVVILGWIFLQTLVIGREVYAVGGNEEAARFSGLRVGRIKLLVYALSGLSAGIAGLVSLGRFGSISTQDGSGYELTVIAAAVVGGASLTGGRGTALGALLGALIIRLIESGIYNPMHWNAQYSQIIIGSAIIVAVAIDRFSEIYRQRRLARLGKR
jgi:ribose/xylose/arabinose/galactoside ABC-type transport system permease subunit